MTETTKDALLGVLTTSADMTETTTDALLVGAAIVDDGSFQAIVVGVLFALFLVILLALALVLLCYTGKRKGTYYTNEAECGDSVDSYGGASQSEKVLLEILNEEE
nr:glycophorin-C isoform X2 [Salvelinus alpinus]